MTDSGSHRPTAHRAAVFDEVASLYAVARPTYPDTLVDDLVRLTGVDGSHRILEIGAGTGQLTVPLAKRGLSIVALERGANLALLLQRNLAPFARTHIVVDDFDDWHAPAEPFDLVVAATAFHWLDPVTRIAKSVRLLRRGGTLAVIHTRWGAGAPGDRFSHESQACYARWDPEPAPPHAPGPERSADLERSGLFSRILHRSYTVERAHTAASYVDLMSTFSGVLRLDPERRSGLLACIADLIEGRFGGAIVRHDAHDMWIATTG